MLRYGGQAVKAFCPSCYINDEGQHALRFFCSSSYLNGMLPSAPSMTANFFVLLALFCPVGPKGPNKIPACFLSYIYALVNTIFLFYAECILYIKSLE
jgi:hypothetical protein